MAYSVPCVCVYIYIPIVTPYLYDHITCLHTIQHDHSSMSYRCWRILLQWRINCKIAFYSSGKEIDTKVQWIVESTRPITIAPRRDGHNSTDDKGMALDSKNRGEQVWKCIYMAFTSGIKISNLCFYFLSALPNICDFFLEKNFLDSTNTFTKI